MRQPVPEAVTVRHVEFHGDRRVALPERDEQQRYEVLGGRRGDAQPQPACPLAAGRPGALLEFLDQAEQAPPEPLDLAAGPRERKPAAAPFD